MDFQILHYTLFRKKELDLEAQLPLRTKLRPCGIAIGLQLSVDRELCNTISLQWQYIAQSKQLADAAANWNRPHIPCLGSLPVSGENRRAGNIPTIREIVVYEILQQHAVHGPVAPPSKRPLIIHQRAQHPMPLDRQHHSSRPHAP